MSDGFEELITRNGTALIGGRPWAVGLRWYLREERDLWPGRPDRHGRIRDGAADDDSGHMGVLIGDDGRTELGVIHSDDAYVQTAGGSARYGHRSGTPVVALAAAAAVPPDVDVWKALLPLDDGRYLHLEMVEGWVGLEGDYLRGCGEEAAACLDSHGDRTPWQARYAPEELDIPDTVPFPMERLAELWESAPRLRDRWSRREPG